MSNPPGCEARKHGAAAKAGRDLPTGARNQGIGPGWSTGAYLEESMDKRLAGKVALVTGGSRGLGVAIASALADEGADVAISYVTSEDKAAAVVAALQAKGVRAVAIQSDQGDPATAEPLLAQVVDQFGK